MAEELQIGDVVFLNSSQEVKLTVIKMNDANGKIACCVFDKEKQLSIYYFIPEALTKVQDVMDENYSGIELGYIVYLNSSINFPLTVLEKNDTKATLTVNTFFDNRIVGSENLPIAAFTIQAVINAKKQKVESEKQNHLMEV